MDLFFQRIQRGIKKFRANIKTGIESIQVDKICFYTFNKKLDQILFVF